MQAKILTPLLCLAATAGVISLAGCGVNGSAPPTNYTSTAVLQGQVFAGRNYMASAIVKIYVTQPTGVATNGTYVGAAKLLKTITANSTGGWVVNLSDIPCTSPDMVYVTAEAGIPYPGALNSTPLSNNPNSLMMTAIGNCSLLTSTASNNTLTIVTNEASTIASVYALRNFISLSGTTVNVTSSATNYAGTGGVGVPGNYAGLAHAFLNANNLSPYKLGAFQQWTGGGTDTTNGGLVTVQELNSLAYAQYLCTIGGDGTKAGDFSYCTTLYSYTTPPGGTAPTNSLQAMLNLARYPSNHALDILAFTQTPIPGTTQTGPQQINAGVYIPALAATTGLGTLSNDWSVAIYYGPGYGGGATGAQATLVPSFVTIDANDSAFFTNPTASSASTSANVVAVKSDGTPLWASPNDTTKAKQPRAVAADAVGHIWTVDAGTPGYVTEFDATTGAQLAQFTSTSNSLYGVAVDSLNNVWYTSNTTTSQNLHELVKSGTTYTEATFSPSPLSATYQLVQVRPDKNNNIWIAGYATAAAAGVYFPNTGTAAAPTYTAGLLYAPLTGQTSTYGITTDAAGVGYAVTNGTGGGIWKIGPSGTGASTVLTPTNSATNSALASRFMDVDGVGNIYYVDNTTGTKLYQYVPSTNAVTGFYPCYNAGSLGGGSPATCATGISTRFDFAIDSTGSIWVASYGNSGGGRLVQILGLAAPTVPLKALGKMGVMP